MRFLSKNNKLKIISTFTMVAMVLSGCSTTFLEQPDNTMATFTIVTMVLSGCSKKVVETISKTEFLMGTVCSVKIYDKSSTKILDKAFKRISEIENIMSINKEDSEVIHINDAAGDKPIKVFYRVYSVFYSILDRR